MSIQLSCGKCGNVWVYRGSKTRGYVTCSSCKHPIRLRSQSQGQAASVGWNPPKPNTAAQSTQDLSSYVQQLKNIDRTGDPLYNEKDVIIILELRLTAGLMEQLQQTSNAHDLPGFRRLMKWLIGTAIKGGPGNMHDLIAIVKPEYRNQMHH